MIISIASRDMWGDPEKTGEYSYSTGRDGKLQKWPTWKTGRTRCYLCEQPILKGQYRVQIGHYPDKTWTHLQCLAETPKTKRKNLIPSRYSNSSKDDDWNYLRIDWEMVDKTAKILNMNNATSKRRVHIPREERLVQ